LSSLDDTDDCCPVLALFVDYPYISHCCGSCCLYRFNLYRHQWRRADEWVNRWRHRDRCCIDGRRHLYGGNDAERNDHGNHYGKHYGVAYF